MAERSRDVPLVLLDVAIGTAVSGLAGLARGRDAVSRLAAPVTGPAARAARTVADRLPDVLDGPLRAAGEAQRTAARAVVESWLGYLLPRLVGAVLDRLDLTELVVSRVDLDRVARGLDVEAVLDRLDLTELVMSRVDLDRIAGALDIEAIAHRLDLNALAARIDLIGLAEQVVVGIDLPQLIRDSTGSVASEGIAGMRMQGMEADQALAHFVDRVLRRRPRPPQPEQGPDGHQPAADDGAAVLDGRAR
ncbi:MAG TPA: hypothetical protein VNC85_02130 [Mycobacteriales bacterium]|nr:hypothetical protein [Mycobacteriales bacterium]